ncbi:hypothetical protein SAMN05421870_107313 [Streptomyces qinglanensis]|uniref:Uncharacterized protein n=1 Tax=Streptomyces qinglanensis TaxID=943816 RepID=A0A1H9U468_9ACTN|nr:hypothetical protein SAMN05421870_107313 [Streptomyces qinglanensis]
MTGHDPTTSTHTAGADRPTTGPRTGADTADNLNKELQ